ncbi:MAG: nitrogen regulation protein NR(II) [Candidatus Krumholzibacteriia bacterium]
MKALSRGIPRLPGLSESSCTETVWWRQLVEQSRDGIVVLDKVGMVVWTNPRFAAMLGYSRSEAMALGVGDWDDAIPREEIAGMLAQVDDSGQHFETVHRRKDGTTFEVEICTNAVEFGERKLVLCICRDISDRKRAERALQWALDESQALTEQLAHHKDMLVQAEKLAALGQLAAGIAHEINNPLAYILSNFASLQGYLDSLGAVVAETRLLAEGRDGLPVPTAEAVREVLLDILRKEDAEFAIQDSLQLVGENIEGAERIRTIVNGLKGFVRSEDTGPAPTTLRDMIDLALLLARNDLNPQCKIVVDLPEDLPPIVCHPRQIEQVLINLLVNAVDATPGEGTITISGEAEGEDRVKLSVRDDGVGIPQENLKRIFDPFFTTKKVNQGTGLGLHLAYSIVDRHGGTIQVSSLVGAGTTFTILLPVQMDPARG